MSFDWIAFLDKHQIPYTRQAHNLTKGNIGCACPLCDWPDKSPETWRLGISPQGRGWSCWHNKEHRGVRPHRLVQAFLKCSWKEVLAIVGDEAPLMPTGDDRSFGAMIGALLSEAPSVRKAAVGPLAFPTSIPPLKARGYTAHNQCSRYMQSRGYSAAEAEDIINRYDLRFPLAGPFRYRVIFPVEHPEGLVSWTGRTARKNDSLRYRALSADSEKAKKDNLPVARFAIKDTLWNMRRAYEDRARVLFACEGPLDGLRIDYYGEGQARAVALFGKSISVAQTILLADIAPLYERCVLLLDPDAMLDAQRMCDHLDFMHFESMSLPRGRKDPALLSYSEVRRLVER